MDLYEALKALHVLAAITWVGAAIFQQVVNTPKVATATGERLVEMAKDSHNFGNRVLIPSTLLLILSGFGMTADADLSLGDFWLSFALAGWIFSFVLGAGYLGPTLGKFHKEVEASGGEVTPTARGYIRTILLWGKIELVILVLVVIDMVVKPSF